jgi:hypothetical protein
VTQETKLYFLAEYDLTHLDILAEQVIRMKIHSGEVPDTVELEDNFDWVPRHTDRVVPPAHPLVSWKITSVIFNYK